MSIKGERMIKILTEFVCDYFRGGHDYIYLGFFDNTHHYSCRKCKKEIMTDEKILDDK